MVSMGTARTRRRFPFGSERSDSKMPSSTSRRGSTAPAAGVVASCEDPRIPRVSASVARSCDTALRGCASASCSGAGGTGGVWAERAVECDLDASLRRPQRHETHRPRRRGGTKQPLQAPRGVRKLEDGRERCINTGAGLPRWLGAAHAERRTSVLRGVLPALCYGAKDRLWRLDRRRRSAAEYLRAKRRRNRFIAWK